MKRTVLFFAVIGCAMAGSITPVSVNGTLDASCEVGSSINTTPSSVTQTGTTSISLSNCGPFPVNTLSVTPTSMVLSAFSFFGASATASAWSQSTLLLPADAFGSVEVMVSGASSVVCCLGSVLGGFNLYGDDGLSDQTNIFNGYMPAISPLAGIFQSQEFFTGQDPQPYVINSTWGVQASGGEEGYAASFNYDYTAVWVPGMEVQPEGGSPELALLPSGQAPEPGTWALAGLALLGLGIKLKR